MGTGGPAQKEKPCLLVVVFVWGGEETSLKHNSFGHPAFRFIWVRFFGEGALFMEAAMRASILGSASSMQNDTSVDNALQIKA